MTKPLILLAIIPLAIGCAATSGASVPNRVAPSKCEIRATPIPSGVRLEAVVRGAPGEIGNYRFTLETNDANGISTVGQGGAVAFATASEIAVAATELSLSRGETYRADISVIGPNGVEKCVQSRLSS